ncbi:SAF domain-containing protein [Micromonospora craterilacus]|uniref:SAF domain-containing protein n=1 Tax=Micromonospora craterilacus TaxID=1655439 RepID=UPI0018F4AFD1|nr:SAF domain-containing protein [Micromonospora craterilacus]
MAAGALLVLATVVTFWQVDLRRHQDQQFLAVARPVPAGAVISDADVRVVRVANPSGLALVEADRRDEVVGRTAAVPLAAGSLVVSSQVGPPAWPPAGQALIAVQVGAGRAPAAMSAGAPVVIVVTASAGAEQPGTSPAGQGARLRAVGTVVSVTGTDQVGGQVVTLLLAVQDAEAVASATGDVALVQLGAGQ